MDYKKLIGRYCYTKEPELVSYDDVFQIPVKVETITELENVAGFCINGRLLVGYAFVKKLIDCIEK